MAGRPKGVKDSKPRRTASRALFAEIVGARANRPEFSPMAVMTYAMARAFNKAKRYEIEAARAESAYLDAAQHDPDAPETAELQAVAAEMDASASEWFDNAVAKAVLVAPYVHPKLVSQPAQAEKRGNPNDLSDDDLAQIAAAEAANAATPDLDDGSVH